mgnify:CR=1 FL=1
MSKIRLKQLVILLLWKKKEDLKKKEFPLKAAVCKSCGYVELYVDVNEE